MTKMEKNMSSNQMGNSSFISIKNTCFIQHFVLSIFNPQKEFTPRNGLFSKDHLNYEIKTRNNRKVPKYVKLIDLDGRISFNCPLSIYEGNLELEWSDDLKNTVIIKLRFETTENKNKAYDSDTFIKELRDIIQNFYNFNNTSKKQSKIDKFLKPHIIGVRNFISLLNSPLRVNYMLKKNQIKLLGYEDDYVYNHISNQQITLERNLSTVIKIGKKNINMFWDDEKEHWYLKDEDKKNVPKRGFFVIPPRTGSQKAHDEKRSYYTKNSLEKLNHGPDCEGSKILRSLFTNDGLKENIINDDKSINKNIEMNPLKREYKKLSADQKDIINRTLNSLIILINGSAGTGKTEVAAIISLFYALMRKKILISSQKNEAINNLYKRIINMKTRMQKQADSINIARFKAKSHKLFDKNLQFYEADAQINIIRDNILETCSKSSNKEKDNVLKKKFKDVFSKRGVLLNLISMTYDIIISTYGNISQHKYLSSIRFKYDLNILEASSSVTLSQFSIGAHNSRQWLILNDVDQLNPLTPDKFLLKQPLNIPDSNEIQTAKLYDPSDQTIKRAKINWGNIQYKKGVAEIFNQFEDNKCLKKYLLNEQYRIHDTLFEFLCNVFNEKYSPSKRDKKLTGNLNDIADLFSKKTHLNYEPMSADEILVQMGKKISQLVDSIHSKNNNSDQLITIGVACTDVQSLKKVITNYQREREGAQMPQFRSTYHQEEDDQCKIVFSSIANHQEKEYDVFILGIVRYGSNNFKKRIYTALTRACTFAAVYGPLVKASKKQLRANEVLLRKLQSGGK